MLCVEEFEMYLFGFVYSLIDNIMIMVDYWIFDYEDIVDINMMGVLDCVIIDVLFCYCGVLDEGEVGIFYLKDLCLVIDSVGNIIEDEGVNLIEIFNVWVEFDDLCFDELLLFRDYILLFDNMGI